MKEGTHMKTYMKIHPSDSVAVALTPLSAGTICSIGQQ